MSKKEKSVFTLAEDFKALITMIPKLEAFIKVHAEITAGYQKYRKNGGEAIPGVEKHLGIKKQDSAPQLKNKKTDKTEKTKAAKESVAVKKTK